MTLTGFSAAIAVFCHNKILSSVTQKTSYRSILLHTFH